MLKVLGISAIAVAMELGILAWGVAICLDD